MQLMTTKYDAIHSTNYEKTGARIHVLHWLTVEPSFPSSPDLLEPFQYEHQTLICVQEVYRVMLARSSILTS